MTKLKAKAIEISNTAKETEYISKLQGQRNQNRDPYNSRSNSNGTKTLVGHLMSNIVNEMIEEFQASIYIYQN